MGVFAWADMKIKTHTVWDIGVLKILCCLVGMIAGAYLSAFVLRFMNGFIVAALLLLIILIVRLFMVGKTK